VLLLLLLVLLLLFLLLLLLRLLLLLLRAETMGVFNTMQISRGMSQSEATALVGNGLRHMTGSGDRRREGQEGVVHGL
jgi:hypothetical protein